MRLLAALLVGAAFATPRVSAQAPVDSALYAYIAGAVPRSLDAYVATIVRPALDRQRAGGAPSRTEYKALFGTDAFDGGAATSR